MENGGLQGGGAGGGEKADGKATISTGTGCNSSVFVQPLQRPTLASVLDTHQQLSLLQHQQTQQQLAAVAYTNQLANTLGLNVNVNPMAAWAQQSLYPSASFLSLGTNRLPFLAAPPAVPSTAPVRVDPARLMAANLTGSYVPGPPLPKIARTE